MSLDSSSRLQWAIDAVQRACALTEAIRKEHRLAPALKNDLSPVTVADYAAQALIAHDLALADPELDIIAEEDEANLRSAAMVEAIVSSLEGWIPGIETKMLRKLLERPRRHTAEGFWTLDPVDGTKGFLRDANYAVALAWVADGRPQLGVLGCPRLQLERFAEPGVLAAARQGEGARVRPLHGAWTELRCSPCQSLGQARLLHSFEAAHTDLDEIARLRARLGLEAPGVGMDSQAKYVMLAAGEGELLIRLLNPARPDYRERIWDHAAGEAILREAGGVITDLQGLTLDFARGRTLAGNAGVLASSSPSLHQKVLDALRLSGS